MKTREKLQNIIPLIMDFRSVLRYGMPSRRTPYCPEVKEETIFVLGTGPSLKDSIKLLGEKSEKTIYFALNDFASNELYRMVKPSYYVIVDPSYFLSKEKISKRDFQLRRKTFSAFGQTDWPMDLFVPSSALKDFKINEIIQNSYIHLRPYNQLAVNIKGSDRYYKWLSNNYISCPVGNVLGVAIYLAINIGFKTINILGAEHSWTKDLRVDDQNRVCTIYRHFFEDNEELVPWLDPFGKPFSMGHIMNIFADLFKGYEILAKYASIKNVSIYNLTPGSFIDAFKRSSL